MTASKLPPSHKDKNNSSDDADQSKSRGFKRRYTDYFDFAPVGYFTFDRAGVILNVNSSGALLLGTNRDSLLRKDFSAFISPDSQPVFDSHSRLLFETRQKQTCDIRLFAGNKASHWVQLESVALGKQLAAMALA